MNLTSARIFIEAIKGKLSSSNEKTNNYAFTLLEAVSKNCCLYLREQISTRSFMNVYLQLLSVRGKDKEE
jgi:hypothetical protein